MFRHHQKSTRRGGIYIAVLSVSLIVAMLGMAALVAQRLQNRMLTASANITQAQLNANSAVELAMLTMKQDTSWRSTQTNGTWFTARSTSNGTCSLSVTDPLDASLADDDSEPVLIRGTGASGQAVQRYEIIADPRRDPLSCLRSAIAASDIDLQSDTLRANSTISANTVSASNSQVYGAVQAVTISGSTYHGTTTQIESAKLPAMPNWASVFNYYRTNGTEINLLNLSNGTPNLGRNINVENTFTENDWTGSPPGVPTSTVSQSNNQNHTSGGTYAIRVRDRTAWYAGVAQPVDGYVKSGQQYTIDIWVYLPSGGSKWFYVSLYTKGSGSAQFNTGPDTLVVVGIWTKVSATITAPAWTGDLEYAFVKVGGADSNNTVDFYADDFSIKETTTGRFMYNKVLSPSLNPFGAQTNAQGIYWINCSGNKIVIERSRILGTLLIVNPGAGSCIANGPIHMSPAVPGYPALLVDADTASDADFAINATNRALNEKENATNFNPTGATHEDFGADNDTNDIYQSGLMGLVAIEDDLTYSNKPLIRGQLTVGDDVSNSSGTLEIQYQPDSLLNPPPGFWAPYTYVRRATSGRKYVP